MELNITSADEMYFSIPSNQLVSLSLVISMVFVQPSASDAIKRCVQTVKYIPRPTLKPSYSLITGSGPDCLS
jgi:hypothetical protein